MEHPGGVYENEEASQSSTEQRSFASFGFNESHQRHREWVFPSIKAPLNHMHEQTANAAIIRMGFGGELVAHGMRSIARTAAEESGKFRTDVLEAALAHSKKDEIIAAYNRAEYLTERVVLMQWWSDYVSSQKCKVIAA